MSSIKNFIKRLKVNKKKKCNYPFNHNLQSTIDYGIHNFKNHCAPGVDEYKNPNVKIGTHSKFVNRL